MGFICEEAQSAALDRQEWRRNVAQCIHLDAGWIKVKVIDKVDTVRSKRFIGHFLFLDAKRCVQYTNSV